MEKVAGTELSKGNGTLYAGWYGPPKTYKTTGALLINSALRPVAYLETERQGSAQHRLKLLCASAEQRAGFVEETPPEAGAWCAEQLDFYWPSATRWYEDCFEFATRVANDYRFVIVDSGSRLADGIMRQALTLDYNGSKGRVTLGEGPTATKHPQPSDYGFVQDRYMTLLQALDESKAHVLVISHEKTAEIRDDATKKLLKCFGGPRSSGNALLEVVPATMDLIVRLEPRSVAQVDAAGKYTGKVLNRAVLRTTNHGEGLNGVMYPCGDRLGIFKDGEIFEPVAFWRRIEEWLGAAAAPR